MNRFGCTACKARAQAVNGRHKAIAQPTKLIKASPQAVRGMQDILRPSVAMINGVSKEPLCAYQLEQQPAEQLHHCTSVIMCRIHRNRYSMLAWLNIGILWADASCLN